MPSLFPVNRESDQYQANLVYLGEVYGIAALSTALSQPASDFVLEMGAVSNSLTRFSGWPDEQVDAFINFVTAANDISWLTNELLAGVPDTGRSKLCHVPVRVLDSNRIGVTLLLDDGRVGIVISRGFVSFLDQVYRLIHFEAFQSNAEEFLLSPPSSESILESLRKTLRSFNREVWTENVVPLLHFQGALAGNIMAARTSSLLFLIAHEFGHLQGGHDDHIFRILSNIRSSDYDFSQEAELSADHWAMSVVLATFRRWFPEEKHQLPFQVGIFLFLITLSLADTMALIDAGDPDKFLQERGHSHPIGLTRFNYISEHFAGELASGAQELVLEYFDLTHQIAQQLGELPQW